MHKLKEKDEATLFSPSEVWCLSAPFPTKPEERELVVDSGASMHMLSRKDLSSAELDNIRVSRNTATVIPANGKVQTDEEATVYVYDLNLFVTVQILERIQQSYRLESSEKITDTPLGGPAVKKHILFQTAVEYNATRTSTCQSLSRVYQPDLSFRLQVHLQPRYRRT